MTGLGVDIIIVDDPIKPEDALSSATRDKINSWITSTLLSRANDKRSSKVILPMQRVHVDDPSATFLKLPATKHLRLPAIADKNYTFILGGAREHLRSRHGPGADATAP